MPESSRPAIVGPQTQITPALFLSAANNAVRRECGWHVAPSVTETLTLDGSGGRVLLLPSGRVTAVASVVADGADVTAGVGWSASGVLELTNGRRFSRRFRSVVVTLTHGYELDDVPDVAALIIKLARRAQDSGTVVAQSTLGSSVSYSQAGGAPLALPLLQGEKDLLAPYRIHRGA